MNMIEEWKVYKITDNRRHGHVVWEVSNYGNVRKNGSNYLLKEQYKYKAFGAGYFVHRAVAELFIGPIPKGYQIDHIDGDKYNNVYTNLRICTQAENMNNPITKEKIRKSRLGKSNGPFSEIARKHISEGHKGLYKGMNRVYDNEEHTKWHMERYAS